LIHKLKLIEGRDICVWGVRRRGRGLSFNALDDDAILTPIK